MNPSLERLAIFLPALYGGGAERTMLKLAGGLAARGYPVDLVLAREGEGIEATDDVQVAVGGDHGVAPQWRRQRRVTKFGPCAQGTVERDGGRINGIPAIATPAGHPATDK